MDLSKEAKDMLETIEPKPSPLMAARKFKETEAQREADRLSAVRDSRKVITADTYGKGAAPSPLPVVDERKKRDDETAEEHSDRMDRLNRAKQKCQNCPHERGHHLLGDCGINNCNCEKFVKRVYERPEHLSDRPFSGHDGLETLKKELAKTASASKKQGRRPAQARKN